MATAVTPMWRRKAPGRAIKRCGIRRSRGRWRSIVSEDETIEPESPPAPATAEPLESAAAPVEQNFRFYDNRQKYLDVRQHLLRKMGGGGTGFG